MAKKRDKTGDEKRGKGERAGGPAAIPDARAQMERMLSNIERIMGEREFESIEEANAFLEELRQSGELMRLPRTTPLDQAQDLVYEAWEASSPKRRVALARKALKVSPDCADAYVLLANETAKDLQEARELYEQAVAAGERAVGPEMFEEEVGHFWSIVSTRPYMRARQGLAEILWISDERQAAIEHLSDMLRLNPNDNQGLRYTLAKWLYLEGLDEQLDGLFQQYNEDCSADFGYTRALHLFRKEGAGRRANAQLREALEINPFVPLYLLGIRDLPQEMPDYIGFGDESEAVAYVGHTFEMWYTTEGAVEWMMETMLAMIDDLPDERRRKPRK